jgi:hypothetical protein
MRMFVGQAAYLSVGPVACCTDRQGCLSYDRAQYNRKIPY